MKVEVTLAALLAEPALIDELAVEELSPLAQPALQTAVAALLAALDSKAAA